MKYFSILLLNFILIISVNAQTKELTLSGIMNDRSIYPERLSQMQWAKECNTFFYAKGNNLIAVDAKGKTKNISTLEILNNSLLKNNNSELKSFPTVNIINDSILIFIKDTFLLSFNFVNNTIRTINNILSDADNFDIDFNKYNVAYTFENNLFVSVKNKIIPLSDSKNKGIVFGQSVHRNEFGIEKGTFWSPQGNYLAFYRMDETMVSDYPLVDIEDPIAQNRMIKYPMAGTKNHVVTVGIFDVKNNNTLYLKTNHWDDQYLTNISWSPDEQFIYIAVLKRNQKEMMLNKYAVSDGSFVKTIFTETNNKYIEPLNPVFFIDKKGDAFIWQSQRDGFNHLFLYDLIENSCIQLTKGQWVVNEIIGFDSSKKLLYFIATKEKPIEKDLYVLDLKKNNSLQKLSTEKGINGALLSYDASLIVNNVSSTEISNRIKLIDNKGKEICSLLDNNPKLKDYLADIEIFSLKAKDGITDLYCRMLKPANMDLNKKYPVIVYVYGGPHSQMINNSWTGGAGLFLHYLANHGYIVFTLDNRGTSNRGLEFEQAIYKNVGEVEVEDQMQGINYLKSLSFIDTTRIGVHGWSYGGFLSINMMLKHPDVFKAGVAGGPVCDWKYYEVMYGERYMSTPEDNPDGYKNSSLLNHIQTLKGKLLVIHDDNDETVVWQNSLMLLKKAIQNGILLDYFVYPGHEHNVRGVDRIHLMRKIEAYFKDYL